MNRMWVAVLVSLCVSLSVAGFAQSTTATLEGRVTDKSGAVLPKATVTAVNSETGTARSITTNELGSYQIPLLRVGDYTVTAELAGFRKLVRKVHLDLGASAVVDFNLEVGQISEQVNVEGVAEALEPTRSMVSSVISEREINTLPVNGRQFIDFALLAPGVTIGDTTSGSTDVIIEPVTKLSFAGQNIHYNFVAVDGADNMSTASGIQKTTPSQEAVQEFRVINSDYSTEFGRAAGGIVNIITKSGTNDWHGSLYEYFRNDAMDAQSGLAAPGGFNKLRQNQFGGTIGGPIKKDKTFFFANYEGQRHSESPFYNSQVLGNLDCPNEPVCHSINSTKMLLGLPKENLDVTRTINYDDVLLKLDHALSPHHSLSLRYFLNDDRSTNLSPLNDGFDLPSGFKDNTFRDQSLVGTLTSTLSSSLTNQVRMQYGHRYFDFPSVTAQPHLEVSNAFTMGVNRGNPEYYEEGRFEVVDDLTYIHGRHTISFGGDFNYVSTTESFPLFYPFEADFANLNAFEGTDFVGAPHPFVLFFERFDTASGFNETTFNPSVFQNAGIPQPIRNQASGNLGHTYNGLYVMDKWRATDRLTLNYGMRWDFETWPSAALNNPMHNFDPRLGISYAFGGNRSFILHAGAGLFHGTIPSPLLMCQIPSCGGVQGAYPGTTNLDSLNSVTRLSAFGSDPFTMGQAFSPLFPGPPSPNIIAGDYPAGSQDAVIVRFNQNHKPPDGAQISIGFEAQPFRNAVLDVTGLHIRGIHLGSFYNINQPDPNPVWDGNSGLMHTSWGLSGNKDLYCPQFPGSNCQPDTGFGVIPGFRNPAFGVYFEADSRWDSQYDGLLVNYRQGAFHDHLQFGVSYTWSKSIDDGPNPSFVLMPQDISNFAAERAVSADDVRNRFVLNFTATGPTHLNRVLNGFQWGTIVTLQSPQYFTKFAGFDANGDVFGNNDRVGLEPRNTFQGDSYQSIDMRLSRTFQATERVKLQAMAEAYNLFNTLNVHFFNTAYGAQDFCNFSATPAAVGCGPGSFLEGSPNKYYGTPRAIFNPRQLQLALRLTF